jgi:hypothetical protein
MPYLSRILLERWVAQVVAGAHSHYKCAEVFPYVASKGEVDFATSSNTVTTFTTTIASPLL